MQSSIEQFEFQTIKAAKVEAKLNIY